MNIKFHSVYKRYYHSRHLYLYVGDCTIDMLFTNLYSCFYTTKVYNILPTFPNVLD